MAPGLQGPATLPHGCARLAKSVWLFIKISRIGIFPRYFPKEISMEINALPAVTINFDSEAGGNQFVFILGEQPGLDALS